MNPKKKRSGKCLVSEICSRWEGAKGFCVLRACLFALMGEWARRNRSCCHMEELKLLSQGVPAHIRPSGGCPRCLLPWELIMPRHYTGMHLTHMHARKHSQAHNTQATETFICGVQNFLYRMDDQLYLHAGFCFYTLKWHICWLSSTFCDIMMIKQLHLVASLDSSIRGCAVYYAALHVHSTCNNIQVGFSVLGNAKKYKHLKI